MSTNDLLRSLVNLFYFLKNLNIKYLSTQYDINKETKVIKYRIGSPEENDIVIKNYINIYEYLIYRINSGPV